MITASQNQRLLVYLQDNDGITQIEALNDLGIMRLASRVSDLKRQGVPIKTRRKTIFNRYAEKCNVAYYSIDE